MKRDWMQPATLFLCSALLFLNGLQAYRLERYQDEMEQETAYLRHTVEQQADRIASLIRVELEESGQLVEKYDLIPTGIDRENKVLTAQVSVTLKEWYEDTEVTLLATLDGGKSSVELEHDGSGLFKSDLAVPMEENRELVLNAIISRGGQSKQEYLTAWSDLGMLLPLQNSGGGWSGPTYANGVLSSQFHISIEGREAAPGPIKHPEFWVYQNGDLVQTLEAVATSYGTTSKGNDYMIDHWSLRCAPEDVINIRFRCEDEYGLGYDFLFADWSVQEIAGEVGAASSVAQAYREGSAPLVLFWPE